jgi:predicted nucleic acid-binding protein
VVEPRSLSGFLKKHRSVYLGTSAFIYLVERHPRYFPVCEELFRAIEAGRTKASASTLTLLEILAQPYRRKNDDLVLKFYALLTTYPHLSWIPMTLNIADQAAKLRAEHGFKTPDAIQASSAISCGATGIVCNDRAFGKISAFESLVLDDIC